MATIQEALESLSDTSIRHIVSLSGGKDSSALAVVLKERFPQLPVEYVFCDTEYELPETYEYLDRLEAFLGKKIVKLNALDQLGIARKPGRKAFDVWLNEYYGGFLPNARTRWCTRVLKIKPFEAFIGSATAYSYIGIRADEQRDGYVAKKPVVISERTKSRRTSGDDASTGSMPIATAWATTSGSATMRVIVMRKSR